VRSTSRVEKFKGPKPEESETLTSSPYFGITSEGEEGEGQKGNCFQRIVPTKRDAKKKGERRSTQREREEDWLGKKEIN